MRWRRDAAQDCRVAPSDGERTIFLPMPSRPDLDRLLRERFGFDAFREGQRTAITTLLDERRLLAIQPTGAGKSLLYQLPALVVDGLTLVISPLLALMRDQLRHLNERFGIPAAAINSDQTDDENARARDAARSGDVRILFVAPERLDQLHTYRFLLSLPVALLVVDEAHCISTWGHDFRPSYRQIVGAVHAFAERHAELRVLGLTATADARTEADIARQLAAADGPPLRVLRATMDRPNIALQLRPVRGAGHKLAELLAVIEAQDGGGIVYCATRDRSELAAEYLQECGVSAVAYHAGLAPELKRELQEQFIAGAHQAICATNALGMGIDKPDVRFVVHFDVPGSITAYYQEVGRAGRDGLPAAGILLFDEDDRRIQDHFIRSSQPTRPDFDGVLDALNEEAESGPPGLTRIKIRTGLHPTRVTVVLAELIEQGFVEKELSGKRQVYVATGRGGEARLDRYERQHDVRQRELAAMLAYARGEPDCLMAALRRALGDGEAAPCGRCGRCRDTGARAPSSDSRRATPGAGRAAAEAFLQGRSVVLRAARVPRMSAGIAVLDGELRTPAHVAFLRHRADPDRVDLPDELMALVVERVRRLGAEHRFGGVVAAPSRDWAQRASIVRILARELQCLPYADALQFSPEPLQRQGELMNNDQRRENVRDCVRVLGEIGSAVTGRARRPVLLVDDFTGSGATLKECARALRKQARVGGDIVPLTITKVRWRLGATGMI